jgi:hypothetical protein
METILEISLMVALIIIIILGYGCLNLLRKNEVQEDAINAFYARTNATVKYMRFLDERKMFESDDEVGETFKLLVETVDNLYSFVTEIRDGDTPTKETQ